jgi:hypothetical protein
MKASTKTRRRRPAKSPFLRTHHVAETAATLRVLNARQAQEGLRRLEADLRVMRERGIIDDKGQRLQRGPGATPEDATRHE